jgi:hypothetical protein
MASINEMEQRAGKQIDRMQVAGVHKSEVTLAQRGWSFMQDIWMIGLALLLGGGVLIGALHLSSEAERRAATVQVSTAVGRALQVQTFPSRWDGGNMKIETEVGFFDIAGTMEIIKDEPWFHEVRVNGDALLCQGNPKRCLRLLRSGVH